MGITRECLAIGSAKAVPSARRGGDAHHPPPPPLYNHHKSKRLSPNREGEKAGHRGEGPWVEVSPAPPRGPAGNSHGGDQDRDVLQVNWEESPEEETVDGGRVQLTTTWLTYSAGNWNQTPSC